MTTIKKEFTQPFLGTPNDTNTFHFMDEKVTIPVSGKDTNGKLAILNIKKPAHSGPPAHIHNNETEIFVVLKGTMTFYVGDEVIEAKEGDVVIAPNGIKHTFITGPEGAEFNVIASPAGFDSFVMALGIPVAADAPMPTVEPPTKEQIIGLVNASKPFGISYPDIEKEMSEK
ncbi:cupin domain-containing protein [Priestia megaterium]|uniref:Cupin domain-containing protein n=1 Tax=Priestia megaterium TaxID=1404 RepID=A0A6M6E8L1_PRIMG|nr:cupin domain-containing protein [Priestia megaterium]QJX79925.1 cupin domain-containing protein [Priestia megaterium]